MISITATVRQILERKPQTIHSISPDATTYDALKMMAEYNVGAVVVMEGGRLVGMLTEREYARRIVLEGKKSRNTPVRDTMNSHLAVVDPDKTLEDCMAIMTDKHIRYLPVIDQERFVGLISMGDVVKNVIAEQSRNIQDLERYISGGEYGF